jgi:hypothetical protein
VIKPLTEIQVFEAHQIARGPDEIRGQPGSLAFIYTRYADPEGNHWFVQPGSAGHEEMTNTRGMLLALFGSDAEKVAEQVVSIGDVYKDLGYGNHIPTGEKREDWDWYKIRRLAKRENLFGRSGNLVGRQVVMLWGDPPGWEAMLIKVLGHLGVERGSEVLIVVGNVRQYRARDFLG